MALSPTPRDTLHRDGTASLYRFRRSSEWRPAEAARSSAAPVLVVPSLINRWYVVDLQHGASLVEALVDGGIDTWCLDWGIPEDEDRYLDWTQVLERLARAVRFVRRETGAAQVTLLGYCMGATLAGIHAALRPLETRAFINLLGPFDFSQAGLLGELVGAEWFDAEAVTAAGNIAPAQMQAGFVALRPTAQIGKWIGLLDGMHDERKREAFKALETWASDNIPFPAAAYRTYIRELYQENRLVGGTHRVKGRTVDLGAISCPVLTIVAEQDRICPPAAATALNDRCSSTDKQVLSVPGGHVGAVVGSRARKSLYPAITQWIGARA